MVTKDTAPAAIGSLLDTDLYKLTMQAAILQHYPDAQVAYAFTNRTPDMRLSQEAFNWLEQQIHLLGNLSVSPEEIAWLEKTCPYFGSTYLDFLKSFKLTPMEQVEIKFAPVHGDFGDISIKIKGRWVDTILYEIPLLAMTSEAYFKFIDKDWNHDSQILNAKDKGMRLLKAGCLFSEFGSRRRRDYKTHELVMQGLLAAAKDGQTHGSPGKLTGTSNVHFAMKFGVNPVGTVAHEWFMGIAALKNDYTHANELALEHWVETYGQGTLGIALTDTFGTPSFLKAFSLPLPQRLLKANQKSATYAETFIGVRQDSGDPLEFLKTMRAFYDKQAIKQKTVIFSDSLDVDKCIQYKEATEAANLTPSFGVGTHFTNDFTRLTDGKKSVPLNIVIKLSEAEGRKAVKLSDNQGKNMGPEDLVKQVKEQVGYTEKKWDGGDEAHRWDGMAA